MTEPLMIDAELVIVKQNQPDEQPRESCIQRLKSRLLAIAQRIVRMPPKREIQVRFLLARPQSNSGIKPPRQHFDASK